jgi:hypothetical protein
MGPIRSAPSIFAGGNIVTAANDRVCGAMGGLFANGHVTLNGCQCGDLGAAGTVSGTPSLCATPAPCPLCVPPQQVSSESDSLAVQPVNDRDPKYVNRLQSDGTVGHCYFFLGRNGVLSPVPEKRAWLGGSAAHRQRGSPVQVVFWED